MLVSDLLHSCANEGVADAAVSSIGGAFARAIQEAAEEKGVSTGFLAACLVRRFARDATERDWRELVDAVKGEDFPVLTGLRIILTKPRHRPMAKAPAQRIAIGGTPAAQAGHPTAGT